MRPVVRPPLPQGNLRKVGHDSTGRDRAKIKDVREKNRPVQLGESILVTEKGAVRLGTRPLVPIATHG